MASSSYPCCSDIAHQLNNRLRFSPGTQHINLTATSQETQRYFNIIICLSGPSSAKFLISSKAMVVEENGSKRSMQRQTVRTTQKREKHESARGTQKCKKHASAHRKCQSWPGPLRHYLIYKIQHLSNVHICWVHNRGYIYNCPHLRPVPIILP